MTHSKHVESFKLKHMHYAIGRTNPRRHQSREVRSLSPSLKHKIQSYLTKLDNSFRKHPVRNLHMTTMKIVKSDPQRNHSRSHHHHESAS
mmetsp:Transcript_14703/g.17008  ORF Transcript_14703/g.17008 Transcript_14703/m.17008 type:complete len:90 (-) Transcript_14703:21-290(-)